MLIDSHAHLTTPSLEGVLPALLKRAQESHVGAIFNICTSKDELERAFPLREGHPWIYNIAATTPHDVETQGEIDFPFFEQAARDKKLVALGETGLDFHYEHSPRAQQLAFLKKYILLSKELDLPLVFHCRDAFEELFQTLDAFKPYPRFILHCFTGNQKDAEGVLERGGLISFSGIVTFKRSEELRYVVQKVPLERLIIETDTPYLAPQSKRGQTNEPAFLPEIAACVAHLKNCTVKELERVLQSTIEKFFALKFTTEITENTEPVRKQTG